jgi:hypothetical protein
MEVLAERRAPADEARVRLDGGHPTGAWNRRAVPKELPLVAAAAFGLVWLILRPFPLDSPVVYGRDVFQHLALIEASDWSGTARRVDWAGAPHGSDWGLFPSGGERLHLMVLHALRTVTGSAVAALNLYVTLALVGTATIAHSVFRWIGCRPVIAGAAACVFTFSPSALHRLAVGHLFLFGLFPVALGVFAVLWVLRRPVPASYRPSQWRRAGWLRLRDWAAPLVAVAVVAVSSSYYAVFTALLLVACASLAALRRGNMRSLVAPLILVVVLGAVGAATLAPDLLARRSDPAASGFDRLARDSETHGLRPTQMVMPRSDHPVTALAGLGERAGRLGPSGESAVVIGFAGIAGLVSLAVIALRRRPDGEDPAVRTVTHLSAVAGSALVLATAGGGGFALAVLGLTQVRVWSRLVAFVLFCSLAGLGMLAQRRWNGIRRFPHLVVLLGMLALVDQGAWVPDHTANTADVGEDRTLVGELLSTHPTGAFVAQLPVVPLPDHMGSERLLAPGVLAGGDLRFTAGAFRGGAGDWQESWLAPDPEFAARAAAAAGAEVLLVQRSHRLVLDPKAVEGTLAAVTGAPLRRTEGGTWAWVDLRPLRQHLVETYGPGVVDRMGREVVRPIGVTYDGIAVQEFSADGRRMTRLDREGALVLHRLDGDSSPVQLRLTVRAAPGTVVEVDAGDGSRHLEPGREGHEVSLEVPLTDPTTRVSVRAMVRQAPQRRSDDDGGVLVTDVTVRDLDAVRSPVLR